MGHPLECSLLVKFFRGSLGSPVVDTTVLSPARRFNAGPGDSKNAEVWRESRQAGGGGRQEQEWHKKQERMSRRRARR